MKKIGMSFILSVFLAGWSMAEPQVKKVTYFPLPYAAYHTVNATNMDLGVGRNPATSYLGNADTSLQVSTATTLTGNNSTLSLNGGKAVFVPQDKTAEIGQEAAANASKVDFNGKLRLNLSEEAEMNNLNTDQMNIKELTLFGRAFPRCEKAGNTMKWVRLKLGPTDCCSWYLACVGSDWDSSNECTENGSASCTTSSSDPSGGGSSDPEEGSPSYRWRWSSKTGPYGSGMDCQAECPSASTDVTDGYTIGSGTLPYNYFIPNCDAKNVGKQCSTGKDKSGYCHQYICES